MILLEFFKKIVTKVYINPSRRHLDSFMREAATSVQPEKYVLDAGAGDCVYKTLFEHVNYHSTDLEQNHNPISFISDLTNLPIAGEKYDLIICTQVLEHVREPEVTLRELHRIMKPTGELWLTVPLYFEEHEIPNDYFRFTQFGIQYLVTKAGFQVRELQWLEGYLGTLSYEMMKTARMLPLQPSAYGHPIFGIPFSILSFFLKPINFLLSLIFSRLDLHHRHTTSGHSKNYAIVAVKKNRPVMAM